MRRDKSIIVFIIFAVFWTIPVIVILTQIHKIVAKQGIAVIFMTIVLIVLSASLWGVVISKLKRAKKFKLAEKEGELFTAQFVSFASNTRVNGISKYRIHYKWKNKEGTIHEGSTQDVYNLDEAYLFKNAQTFRIRAMGKISVIIDEPSTLVYDNTELDKKEVLTSCEYCNSVYSMAMSKCPHCGATRKGK